MRRSKRTLLKSNKIAQLVLMEAKLLTEEKRILDNLINEGRKMEMAGYDQIAINEGIMDMLKKFGGDALSGGIEKMKEYFVDGMLRFFGLDPKANTAMGLVGCAIKNSLGNLTSEQFQKLITGTTSGFKGFNVESMKTIWGNVCEDVSDLILQGVTECAVEKAQDSDFVAGFYGAIVGQANVAAAKDNPLWAISDEMFQNFINDTAVMESIRKAVTDFVCGLNIVEMMEYATKQLGNMASGFLDMFGLGDVFGGGSPAKA